MTQHGCALGLQVSQLLSCAYVSCIISFGVQGEEEGPGDILDEELQQQLNEIADYESGGEEEQPAGDQLAHELAHACAHVHDMAAYSLLPAYSICMGCLRQLAHCQDFSLQICLATACLAHIMPCTHHVNSQSRMGT